MRHWVMSLSIHINRPLNECNNHLGGKLTEDQEKAIERMIIGGLEDTHKKTTDVQGTTRTAIPKSHQAKASGDMHKQIVELAKLVDEATSRINYKKAAVARPQITSGNQQFVAGNMLRKFIAIILKVPEKYSGRVS